MSNKDRFSVRKMIVPVVIMFAFLALGTVMWVSSGYVQALFFFGYIGASIGVGLGLYAGLPKRKKPWAGELTLFLVGGLVKSAHSSSERSISGGLVEEQETDRRR